MLDIKVIRENPQRVKDAMKTRNKDMDALVDEVLAIDDTDAIAMAQKLSVELGLPVGISGGANFLGTVLCGVDNAASVFADDNKKYLSTDLANKISTPLTESIEFLAVKTIRY